MTTTIQAPPSPAPEMPTQNPPGASADALVMILAFTLFARVILGSTSSKSP